MPPPPPLNREYPAGSTVAFSGSGEELNKNNSYPHKAGFAQPSGLAIADNGFMYVADSESSTVRAIKLDSGAVQACVGGALDPSVRAMHNFVLQIFPAMHVQSLDTLYVFVFASQCTLHISCVAT